MLNIDTITSHISKIEYVRMWKKTTVCCITLDNWFEVIWSSACIDEKDFDEEIWKSEARGMAIDKLWELYWFLLHCNNC